MLHWGKVEKKLKNEVLSFGILTGIFCVHPIPPHLSLQWAARKRLGVSWEGWGLLNGEAHRQGHCSPALDAAHGCWRRWKELTLPLVVLEKETPKRRDVVGTPVTAEANVSFQNRGLKGDLEVLSLAQSRANLGQAAQGCSPDASRASSRLSSTIVNIFPCT